MIIIKNKRCKLENIRKEYPGAIIFDVTSKGALKTLSPFYPHGNIGSPVKVCGLGIDLHQSEEKELTVNNTSELCSEMLDLCIEGFC